MIPNTGAERDGRVPLRHPTGLKAQNPILDGSKEMGRPLEVLQEAPKVGEKSILLQIAVLV